MRLLGPAPDPRRWERARSVVEENLRRAGGGLPSIALVDELTQCGFREEEAMAVLRAMHEEAALGLVAGRWVLLAENATAEQRGP